MKKIWIYAVPLLAFACHAQEKEPAVPGLDKLKIVYNVLADQESDNYEIFIMDSDGQNKRNLSNHEAVDWAYYAYEDKIYFLSDRDTTRRKFFLYEMDRHGNDIRRISREIMADSWFNSRNNNSEFIVRPHSSVDSAFYIIDPEGKRLKRLQPGLPYINDPAFSPDGAFIVFRGGRTPSKRVEGFSEELFLMKADGTGLTQMTQYPAGDTTAEWFAYHAGPPKWHPSGEFVSYQSKQAGKYSLYAVDRQGNQRKLTSNDFEEGYHSWSPDGNHLAIEIFDSSQRQFHIALMNRHTKEIQILTDSSYQYQQAPVFVYDFE